MKTRIVISIIATVASVTTSFGDQLSDRQIKSRMVQESISTYQGNCPCPFNFAKNGSKCGRRSAYSRPGGETPLCYAKDITPEMLREFKSKN
jgi:hypothetical protein